MIWRRCTWITRHNKLDESLGFFHHDTGDAVDKDESYSPVGKEFTIRNYFDATPQQ